MGAQKRQWLILLRKDQRSQGEDPSLGYVLWGFWSSPSPLCPSSHPLRHLLSTVQVPRTLNPFPLYFQPGLVQAWSLDLFSQEQSMPTVWPLGLRGFLDKFTDVGRGVHILAYETPCRTKPKGQRRERQRKGVISLCFFLQRPKILNSKQAYQIFVKVYVSAGRRIEHVL